MKQKKLLLATLLMSMLPICEALAWGQEGHRIIGQIAYNHLSCVARHKVDRVLGKHGLVYWANWPDEIKSDTIYPQSSDWHFQDMDAGMSDAEVVATLTDYPKQGGNLWRATDSLVNVLRHDPNNYDALRFLIHLEGDRFCPMHTAHMDDRGGNSVKFKWFGQNRSLHSIWDSSIIDSRGYTYSEFAEYLEDSFTREEKKAIQKMTKEEITVHNYHLTDAIYTYQQTWDGNAYHYVYHFSDALNWQLYAAGIKLAQLLEILY